MLGPSGLCRGYTSWHVPARPPAPGPARPGTDWDACTFQPLYWPQARCQSLGNHGCWWRRKVQVSCAVCMSCVCKRSDSRRWGRCLQLLWTSACLSAPQETPTLRLEQPTPGRACWASGERKKQLSPLQPIFCHGWNMAPLKTGKENKGSHTRSF